jgi:hypothetical protein
MSILQLPLILETRRNHAIEHGTIHILGAKFPGQSFAGHSNPTGFIIIGDVAIEDVANAATQSLTRLRAGERELAIHPGCGTNFATSGLLAATLAWLPLSVGRTRRTKLFLLPFAVLVGVLGYVFAQPFGPVIQAKVTTEADPGETHITRVSPVGFGKIKAHYVTTRPTGP